MCQAEADARTYRAGCKLACTHVRQGRCRFRTRTKAGGLSGKDRGGRYEGACGAAGTAGQPLRFETRAGTGEGIHRFTALFIIWLFYCPAFLLISQVRNAAPVALVTAATIFSAIASISASVSVLSFGCRRMVMAMDFLPSATPLPS